MISSKYKTSLPRSSPLAFIDIWRLCISFMLFVIISRTVGNMHFIAQLIDSKLPPLSLESCEKRRLGNIAIVLGTFFNCYRYIDRLLDFQSPTKEMSDN